MLKSFRRLFDRWWFIRRWLNKLPCSIRHIWFGTGGCEIPDAETPFGFFAYRCYRCNNEKAICFTGSAWGRNRKWITNEKFTEIYDKHFKRSKREKR